MHDVYGRGVAICSIADYKVFLEDFFFIRVTAIGIVRKEGTIVY